MIDFIIIAVIVLFIGGATAYIVKSKKSGKKCIGCPYANACQSKSCCKSQNTDEGNNPNDKF